MAASRTRCQVVCWATLAEDGDKLDVAMDMARVPVAGERIELPDGRLYVVHRVSWTTKESSRWNEQMSRIRPLEPTPVVEVRIG